MTLETLISATTPADIADALVDLVKTERLLAGGENAPAVPGLLERIEASTEAAAGFAKALERLLLEADGTSLFGETGIPGERGFFAELGERLSARLVPAARDERDLSELFHRLFTTSEHVTRFQEIPLAVFHRLAAHLAGSVGEEAWGRVRAGFADGFRLLLIRIQAHGLSRDLRRRATPGPVSDSPFQQIAFAGDALLSAWLAGNDTGAEAKEFRRASGACRKEMRVIQKHLTEVGVSVEIVFGLEVIERCLTRTALMADVLEAPEGPERSRAIHRFLSRLALRAHQDRSLGHLLRWNLHLLDRRIVDRSSETGEHYVAASRKEYRQIWLAAAGGGLLTVGTAAVKMRIHGWHLAAFPESFLYGLNYAVSFLLLQAFGLILATKQPAMTAAALATIMRDSQGEDREERIAGFFSRLVGSQLAAAAANVLSVAAGCTAFTFLYALVARVPFLEPDESRQTFASLSPLDSGTIFFAALTGVLLWLGSLAGGWFENWTAYHRLPAAIAEHPLRRRLGAPRMERIARALERNASGWGTNVALGFLLGFAPAVGRFFGIPFDVRHVTLSTGTLALAAASLGREWFGSGFFLRALSGIAVMFVLNLSVSFTLSLWNAARAYEMSTRELAEVLRLVATHLVKRPLDFVRLPPDAAEPPPC